MATPNLVVNPTTGREIKVNSPAYRALIHSGWVFNANTGLKPPANKLVEYVFSNIQKRYIKIGSAEYKRVLKGNVIINGVIQPKTDSVMGPNKRRIKMGTRAYNQLLAAGYTYDAVAKRLIYPVQIETINSNGDIPVGFADKCIENLPTGEHKYSHFEVISITPAGDDDLGTFQINPNTTTTNIRDWWYNTLSYDIGADPLEIKLYPARKAVNFGPAYMDASQGDAEEKKEEPPKNCVIKELEAHFNNKDYSFNFDTLYEQFEEGVFEEDYEILSKKLKIPITLLVNNKEYKFGPQRTQHAAIKLWYRNNHVVSKIKDFKEKTQIWKDELKFEDFDDAGLASIVNVISGKDKIYAIETDAHLYRLKEDEKVDLQEFNENLEKKHLSATAKWTDDFLKANKEIYPIQGNHSNLDAIKTICQNGVMFSVLNQDLEQKEQIQLDLKSAYSNYMNYDSYTGFPCDLSICIDCSNIKMKTILSILNESEGFGLMNYKSVFTGEKVKRWVSFPYIRNHINRVLSEKEQEDFSIDFLLIGTNRVEKLDLTPFQGKDTPKRAFHKVLGRLIRNYKNESFITTDPVLGMACSGSLKYVRQSAEQNDIQVFQCNTYIPHIGYIYYPHITGYIQQYVEIELENMYASLKTKQIPISRVWVDGINIPADDLKKIAIDIEIWHIKPVSDKLENFEFKQRYLNGQVPIKYSTKYNKLITNKDTKKNRKFAIIGEPGTGKSYNAKELFNQLNNSIILVPKHELKENFENVQVETIQSYVLKHTRQHECILVDEYTLVSQDILEQIEDFDRKLVIICGDKAQLEAFKGEQIQLKPMWNQRVLIKNYRQMDKVFLAKLKKLRKEGNEGLKFITQKISAAEATKNHFRILSSTHEEIDRINKIGDEQNPGKILFANANGGYKEGTPVRWYRSAEDERYLAGWIGKIVAYDKKTKKLEIVRIKEGEEQEPHIFMSISAFEGKDPIIVKAYSETYHGVQGKTIRLPQNIVINMDRLFDNNMGYVGCSRAKEEKQLYLLSDKEEKEESEED